MSNRVLCQIWVLIKFKFHNPSSFPGSLFNIFYRATGTKCYCRVEASTKLHIFTTPFPFRSPHIFCVKWYRFKMRMSNRVLCQIRVRIKFKFHNPRLFYGSLFNILYRGTGTKCYCRIWGLYETSQFHNPISFPEVNLFFVLLPCRVWYGPSLYRP